ncbi:MAG: AMP-binding protein [Myxococcales bacterium]|nr:AMP-binding protein [Myxococcales bacterium]
MSGPLVQRLFELAREREPHLAIIDDRERVTFGLLGARVTRVANQLRARGLGGKRVALLVTQGSRWLEAFLGIIAADATAVPLSHLHPDAEQAWFVEVSRAAALLVSEETAARVAGYQGELPVLHIEALRDGADGAGDGVRHEVDAAVILYTSGTTGKPKGALISQENLESTARLLGSAWQWSADDVLLHCLPLHHLHGLGIALLTSLLGGGTTRMLEKFDGPRLWEELAHASVLMGVPTMHKKLLDTFDAADSVTRTRWADSARNLRLVTSGSAALPATVGERWRELTGNYPLERFGMTEIGVGSSNPVDGERVPGSAGPALPGMLLRIVRDDGSDAPRGESGEIWLKGPSVFLGYDDNVAATREAFSDGWFRSGDTATFLEAEYVKILGRTSVDILKSGGYKLSALEIEEVLREHDAVADVAVVGLPDETWGEIAVAAVIAREGRAAELAGETLRDFAKARIASYKVPKRVIVLDDFPRNPVGKVVKPELLKRLTKLG